MNDEWKSVDDAMYDDFWATVFAVGTYNGKRWFGWYYCGPAVDVTKKGVPFILYESYDYDDEFEDDFSGAPASFGPPETIDAALAQGMDLPTIEEAEQALLREALRRFDGNRRQTAEALGISERTLYRKVKDLEDEEA